MSGGYFNYQQYLFEDIAQQIEHFIKKSESSSPEDFHYYNQETLQKFREAVNTIRQAGIMTQRIDWLVSGDDGEEEFHKRLQEELNEIQKS